MVKVIAVEAILNHKLEVKLSNGRKGVFDVSPYLDKGIFQELRDPKYFRQVRCAYGGVKWPHDQDFSAETIEHELQQQDESQKVIA